MFAWPIALPIAAARLKLYAIAAVVIFTMGVAGSCSLRSSYDGWTKSRADTAAASRLSDSLDEAREQARKHARLAQARETDRQADQARLTAFHAKLNLLGYESIDDVPARPDPASRSASPLQTAADILANPPTSGHVPRPRIDPCLLCRAPARVRLIRDQLADPPGQSLPAKPAGR